jgi:hypothetical protein
MLATWQAPVPMSTTLIDQPNSAPWKRPAASGSVVASSFQLIAPGAL